MDNIAAAIVFAALTWLFTQCNPPKRDDGWFPCVMATALVFLWLIAMAKALI